MYACLYILCMCVYIRPPDPSSHSFGPWSLRSSENLQSLQDDWRESSTVYMKIRSARTCRKTPIISHSGRTAFGSSDKMQNNMKACVQKPGHGAVNEEYQKGLQAMP